MKKDIRGEVECIAKELAEAADITEEGAMSVLKVLGIEKLMVNYRTADQLLKEEDNMRALSISKKYPLIPEFMFSNLGLAMHDNAAALVAVPK